ncbi:MAG TPA: hypothetical protein VGU63_02805 [Candidatus Acidoferrales bacterium]|nr:hypothetical protein [Candidatus Acidoferrales bacterium]
MNRHIYLRAYMAGVTVPAAVLLLVFTIFVIARFVYQVPIPIERVIVFPMALIPNVFGAWNILYIALGRRWPIGLHGAVLPFLLAPAGYFVAAHLHFLAAERSGVTYFEAVHIPYGIIAVVFPIGVAIYYLIWKYLVGFLNELVGLTE